MLVLGDLVGLIVYSQACSSSSFQSADDQTEVVMGAGIFVRNNTTLGDRWTIFKLFFAGILAALIVFAYCKCYWIIEYKFIITSFEEFLKFYPLLFSNF